MQYVFNILQATTACLFKPSTKSIAAKKVAATKDLLLLHNHSAIALPPHFVAAVKCVPFEIHFNDSRCK